VVKGAYVSGEMSSNAGGLIRWPMYALVPIGFALLGLQGISELIKRFAFLQGKAPNPLLHGAHDSHDEAHAHPHHDDAGEVQK
jgi:TRAP-type mannitol/chloroaromatic compound transport system permease small subunit